MRELHAFVDESGLFDSDEPYPMLAAFVVSTPDVEAFDRWARARVQHAVPHVNWPPHTTYLNLPIYHAFAAVAAGVPAVEDEIVVDYVRRSAPEIVERILSRIRDRLKVKRDLLSDLEAWIQTRGSEAGTALEDVAVRLRHSDAAVRDLLNQIGRRYPGSFVAAAAETYDCEAVLSAEGRYFSVFDALIERLQDAIGRDGDVSVLKVSALELPVDVGTSARRPLDLELLKASIDRVKACRAGSTVLLDAGSVKPYDQHVDAGFVLADFVANRAGNVLRRGGTITLAEAHAALDLRVALPSVSGNPSGSHLAASGTARRTIDAVRKGLPVPPWPDGARRWAREQTDQWATIAI